VSGAVLPSVLVLAGGPDEERPVSIESASGVAAGLRRAGAEVHQVTIERPALDELRAMPGEIVFPVLHGAFGEGGPLQDLLEALGRPFVGCGPSAARLAMDKLATKLLGASLGVATKPACVLNVRDRRCPLPMPVVVKPVHDGSSVGLHLCPDADSWERAQRAVADDIAARPGRAYMIEPMIRGRELTVGIIEGESGLRALPLIEIVPASGVYDYAAKYVRDDTRYVVEPGLPAGVADRCRRDAIELARAIGVRHLSRVDFLLDGEGEPWLLEINTMPGFTSHSLLPMAAARAGMDMASLCAHLARMAWRRMAGV